MTFDSRIYIKTAFRFCYAARDLDRCGRKIGAYFLFVITDESVVLLKYNGKS